MNLTEIRKLLEKYDASALKKYGQNFLIDDNILNTIADSLDNESTNVIEIGPGLGSLTRKLVTRYEKVLAYLEGKKVYVFDGLAGADEQYQMQTRIVNEYAHQNLFMHQLLVRPTAEKLENYAPALHMVCAPGFKCDPEADGVHSDAAIILDLEKNIILILVH